MKSFLKSHTLLCGFFVIIVGIIIDQIAKHVVQNHFPDIVLCNFGVAMGIIIPKFIFILLWCVVMVGVSVFWVKSINESFVSQLPFLLIISGGVGNTIDRFAWGCVVDFIPLLRISSFNIADVLISLGATLWIYQIVRSKSI